MTSANQVELDIQQEREMIAMLEQSMQELESTCEKLEKRSENLDDESNEWKTRYETQCDVNEQLMKQLATFKTRTGEAKDQLEEIRKPKPQNELDAENYKYNRAHILKLERDKAEYERQLKDIGWRLDQESKAYHKANEVRKQYAMEINFTKDQIERIKKNPPPSTPHSPWNGVEGKQVPRSKRDTAVKHLPPL